MNLTDACDNAYHNGYEQGYKDALDTVEKIIEELKTKGEQNGKEVVESLDNSSVKNNGADRYCEHRNICALN